MNNNIKNHRINPRPEAWDRIEERLDHTESKREVKHYKNISIAAILVCVLAASFLMTHFIQSDLSSPVESSYVVSNLEVESGSYDYLYAPHQIASLEQAYENAGLGMNN